MVLKIVCVWDRKAGVYQYPMGFRTIIDAARAFGMSAVDKSTSLGRNPEDFELHELGTLDDETGVLENHPEPKPVICRALDFTQG